MLVREFVILLLLAVLVALDVHRTLRNSEQHRRTQIVFGQEGEFRMIYLPKTAMSAAQLALQALSPDGSHFETKVGVQRTAEETSAL